MTEFELSPEARQDLIEIYVYGYENFGENRADCYLTELYSIFMLLKNSPQIGRMRPELGDDLRSLPHAEHVVFYMVWKDMVHIVRVLHGSRDIQTAFEGSPSSSR